MERVESLFATLLGTLWDVLPIAAVVFGFQVLVLRSAVPNLRRVLWGFACVLVGLACFIEGLERALFPLGRLMASQLTAPEFIAPVGDVVTWGSYYWVYLFGAAIGFSSAIAEPALIAVARKANRVSGGTVSVWGLRLAVAIGVAAGVALGTVRIVTGTPLHWYIISGYLLVMIQTLAAPQAITALAYDSGGVSTSTVTVPLVAALGLGLASTVPGRSPMLDGFGLIAFACLFPIISVLAYAQLAQWRGRRQRRRRVA